MQTKTMRKLIFINEIQCISNVRRVSETMPMASIYMCYAKLGMEHLLCTILVTRMNLSVIRHNSLRGYTGFGA